MSTPVFRVALAHAGMRTELDAAELEARLELPGLALRLVQVLSAFVGDTGGSKNPPGSPVTLNAYQSLSGNPGGNNQKHGGNDDSDDVDKLCNHLADALDDRRSLAWYRQVVRLVPREVVLDAFARARELRRDRVRRSRAALFTALVRPHLILHERYAHPTSSPPRTSRHGPR